MHKKSSTYLSDPTRSQRMFDLLKRSAKGVLSTRHLLQRSSGHRFILCYHHLASRIGGVDASVYTTTIERFKDHLSALSGVVDFVPLDELIHEDARGRKRNRASITFDDGFTSVFTIARPLLRERGIPYTVFLNGCAVEHGQNWVSNVLSKDTDPGYATGLMDSAGLAVDKGAVPMDPLAVVGAIMERGSFGERFVQAYRSDPAPVDLYMGRAEVKQLVKERVVVGDHGWDHPVLSRCDAGFLHGQLSKGSDLIAELVGERPRHFALPFGKKEHFNAGTLDLLASQGFSTVHTTNPNNLKWTTTRNGLHIVPRIGFTDNSVDEVFFYLNRSLLRHYDL